MWRLLVAGLLLLDAPIAPARADVPAAGPPSDITVSVIRGQMAVRSRCSSCHAVGLDDASPNPRSPPLRTIGRIMEALQLKGIDLRVEDFIKRVAA